MTTPTNLPHSNYENGKFSAQTHAPENETDPSYADDSREDKTPSQVAEETSGQSPVEYTSHRGYSEQHNSDSVDATHESSAYPQPNLPQSHHSYDRFDPAGGYRQPQGSNDAAPGSRESTTSPQSSFFGAPTSTGLPSYGNHEWTQYDEAIKRGNAMNRPHSPDPSADYLQGAFGLGTDTSGSDFSTANPQPPYAPGDPFPRGEDSYSRGRGSGILSRIAFIVLLVVLAAGAGVGGAAGWEYFLDRENTSTDIPRAVTEEAASIGALSERVKKSVVTIWSVREGGRRTSIASGSGSVIDSEGTILTNAHVTGGGSRLYVGFEDGLITPARLIAKDDNNDIALLQAQGVSNLTPLTLGEYDEVTVGQDVLAFGSPRGLPGTLTKGVVSATQRPFYYADGEVRHQFVGLQTDADINPGNSGGPLLNLKGELIGMNSAVVRESSGLGGAIPVNLIKRVVKELRENGKVRRGYIGVRVAGGEGVGTHILAVEPGGPAAKANLPEDVYVTRINGVNIMGEYDLSAFVASTPVGGKITLTYSKKLGGAQSTVEITVAEVKDN